MNSLWMWIGFNLFVLVLLALDQHLRSNDQWEQWRFEVVDMDGNRIDKVLASPLPVLPSGKPGSRSTIPSEKE